MAGVVLVVFKLMQSLVLRCLWRVCNLGFKIGKFRRLFENQTIKTIKTILGYFNMIDMVMDLYGKRGLSRRGSWLMRQSPVAAIPPQVERMA